MHVPAVPDWKLFLLLWISPTVPSEVSLPPGPFSSLPLLLPICLCLTLLVVSGQLPILMLMT